MLAAFDSDIARKEFTIGTWTCQKHAERNTIDNAPTTAHNNSYLEGYEIGNPWMDGVKPWAIDLNETERLWKLSEELVGQEFVWRRR